MSGREPFEALSIKRQKPTPKDTPTIQVATTPVDTRSQMGPSDLLRATVFWTIGRIVESLSVPADFGRNVGMVTRICALARLRLGIKKAASLIGHTRDNDGMPIFAVSPGTLCVDLMLEPLCHENRIRRVAVRQPQNAGRSWKRSLVRTLVRFVMEKASAKPVGTGEGCGWQVRTRRLCQAGL